MRDPAAGVAPDFGPRALVMRLRIVRIGELVEDKAFAFALHALREIARRLRFIAPATSFRSAYAYDNVLYAVAGEVVAAVSGLSWEDFVSTRILAPVGMKGSAVRVSHPDSVANAAMTHGVVEGELRPVTPYLGDLVNPAGGIFSNAEDMARWMITQLDSGRVADGRVFSSATTRQLWRAVTPVPFGDPPPELAPLRRDFNFYALGLGVQDYRGRRILTHTGGLPGYLSRVTMVPELKLGVVVLTNMESGEAFNAVVHRVLDHYLGVEPFDWLAAYGAVSARQSAELAAFEAGQASQRDPTSKPSLALDRYAGTYRDAWYGDVQVTKEGGGLVLRFSRTPTLVGDLEHWQYDTFLVRWRLRELRADAFITFSMNPDGSIERALMKPASPAVDFSYDFQDLLLRPVGR